MTTGHVFRHPGIHRFQRSHPQREARVVPWHRLWDRQLTHYPSTAYRYLYLGITVAATIVLYYELYVQSAVAPSVMNHFGMSWPFFVYVLVVGNAIGAFGSLAAGLADRWGRANMVAYGLLATALIALVGLPQAPNRWAYGALYSLLCIVEGMVLVATPALIRDFSPQLGRASAMGFWTIGPVIGSLTVSLVSSHTLNHLTAWQDQFMITGFVGLAIFAIALVGLRELSPRLRDQLMVSARERVLVEAKAAGVDVEASLKHPWRQMVKPNIVLPAFGISVFLVIYYAFVAFFVVFMASIFGYSQLRANLLGNWIWAFNAGSLVVVGIISDRLRVRKPFMVVGIALAMAMTALFAIETTHPSTGYYTFAWTLSLLAVGLGLAFAPWLAAFSETVEDRNPALTATGLAIWGWVLRIVVAVSFLITPFVVTSMTPIVQHGSTVSAASTKYAGVIAFAQANPKVVADAQKYATQLSFASTHPTVVSDATKYAAELTFAATHPAVVAAATKLAPELAAVQAHAALFTQLAANPTSAALIAQAQAAVGPAMFAKIVANQAAITSLVPYMTQLQALAKVPSSVTGEATQYASELQALQAVPASVLSAVSAHASQLAALSAASADPAFQTLEKHGTEVASAVGRAPREWQRWWWVCFGVEALMLPTLLLLRGRWRPKSARRDHAERERMINEQIAALGH